VVEEKEVVEKRLPKSLKELLDLYEIGLPILFGGSVKSVMLASVRPVRR
jgi:hypothetical protein